MLLFLDSFDHYVDTGETGPNPEGFEQKWDSAATEPVINSTGRTASCANFNSSQSISKVVRSSDSNSIQYITGFAFKRVTGWVGMLTNIEFMSYRTAANARQLSLALKDQNGALQLRTGTSGATLLAETNSTFDWVGGFHYIELAAVIHNTTGSFELRVDGVAVPLNNGAGGSVANPATNVNTGTSTGMSVVEFGHGGEINGMFLDDLYICDNTAVTNSVTNTFLGNVKVVCTFPILDGNYEDWTKSADNGVGANNSAVLVDDPPSSSPCPDGDATYVSSTTTNHRSSFICTDISSIADPLAVQVVSSMRTDSGNTRSGAVFLRIGGADYDGTGMVIGTSAFSMLNDPGTTDGRRKTWDVNPDGNTAWTLAVLNNSEIGALVVA